MYAVLTEFDRIAASANVDFDDTRQERLRIVQDDIDEETYTFVWRTTDVNEGEFTFTTRDVDGHSMVQLCPWSIQWRGNLQACLRAFGEVHGDLVVEAATVKALSKG